ncbi:MAG: hypothetical protein ABI970_23240 [Chloroflexota bacterium]
MVMTIPAIITCLAAIPNGTMLPPPPLPPINSSQACSLKLAAYNHFLKAAAHPYCTAVAAAEPFAAFVSFQRQ